MFRYTEPWHVLTPYGPDKCMYCGKQFPWSDTDTCPSLPALVIPPLITEEGKFRGEARYVPYFWDKVQRGECGESDGMFTCEVKDDDVILFPELVNVPSVTMIEKNGSIYAYYNVYCIPSCAHTKE